MPLTLTSESFENHGLIPVSHTCDGGDVSPPLSWAGMPAGAKILVLIVDDPGAPDPRRAKNDLGALGAVQPATEFSWPD
jgi:phosphatidylethanolamine-binding protein (PEBP) family uncharacterized protein